MPMMMNKSSSAFIMAALHVAILLLALTSCDAVGRPLKRANKPSSASSATRDVDDGQCSTPGDCPENAKTKDATTTTTAPAAPCSLYLAPSTIPNAGLGIFSGRQIPMEESVHEYLSYCEEEDDWISLEESAMWTDVFVPVWNRNQRPFASWMGYVWPESPGAMWNDDDDDEDQFDGDFDLGLAFVGGNDVDGNTYLAEDGRRTPDGDGGLISPVSAYAFGLASLANSHPFLHNMERDVGLFENLEQKENHKGLLFPHQTPGQRPGEQVMLNAPWDAGVGAFVPTYGNDFVATKWVEEGTELLLNYGKRWHMMQGWREGDKSKAAKVDVEPAEEQQQNIDIVRSPEWLAENGVCLFSATLTSSPSHIPHAGRGAFTGRAIQKGEVLAISPMLAVARDDLKVAHSNNGDQMLLNYAFGHSNSSLLLVPMAPVVEYMNHSNETANAEIRWPRAGSNAQKLFSFGGDSEPNDTDTAEEGGLLPWLSLSPAEVLKMSGKIALEYVALRDIEKGEEIVINYGEGWEESWTAFASMHPYERPGYFRREAGVPDGFFPEAWLDLDLASAE